MRERDLRLDLLSEADRTLPAPRFERVDLSVRQPLVDRDAPIEHVHFLLGGLSSEIASADEANRIEVGCVGREGQSGHTVLLGVDKSPHHAFVAAFGPRLEPDDVHGGGSPAKQINSRARRYHGSSGATAAV